MGNPIQHPRIQLQEIEIQRRPISRHHSVASNPHKCQHNRPPQRRHHKLLPKYVHCHWGNQGIFSIKILREWVTSSEVSNLQIKVICWIHSCFILLEKLALQNFYLFPNKILQLSRAFQGGEGSNFACHLTLIYRMKLQNQVVSHSIIKPMISWKMNSFIGFLRK